MSRDAGLLAQRTTHPSTSPFVSFLPFADGGVIFADGSHRLWALNAPAAFVWCCLDESESVEQLASIMAKSFAISQDVALRDIEEILLIFQRQGLLSTEPENISDEIDSQHYLQVGPPALNPSDWPVREFLSVAGVVFEFRSADLLLGRECIRLFHHLKSPHSSEAECHISLHPCPSVSDHWDFAVDGRICLERLPRVSVVSSFVMLLFVKGCEACDEKLLFHAAVLGRGRRMILFPAEAGSGKTTLAALLAANGFDYYSDEIAVIDKASGQVVAFPLPMSIKDGSVPVLERYYPEVPLLSSHLRLDGRRVRFLLPPPTSLNQANAADIAAIVFPNYQPSAEIKIHSVDKIAALTGLAKTGSSDRKLCGHDVKAILRLVEKTPCYDLIYSVPDDALRAISDLLA